MDFKKVKWLFFDLGSTLIDESEAYKLRVSECIEGSNVTFAEFDEKRKLFAAERITCGDQDAAAYFGLNLKPWRNDVEYPYKDAEIVLKALHERGYHLAVIANQAEGTALRLKKWKLYDYFDFILASYEEGVSKPDHEIFLRALKRADASGEDCVMIGDRIDNDVKPAKELGLKTVLVKHGVVAPYQQPPTAAFIPTATVFNLTDLLAIFL